MDNIFNYIRTQRDDYETREIPLFEGKDFSQYTTINKIDMYWSNTYLEDAYDEVIGAYPFDNVSKFRILLEARATDFDLKHIEIEPETPDKESRVSTMIATKALYAYHQKINFAKTLNEICMTRPKYGGVHVTQGKDEVIVTKWQNIINDQSDLMAGVRIIRHYYTPAEISAREGGWKNTKEAIRTAVAFREKDIGDDLSDTAHTQGDLIEVFEVIGVMEKDMYLQAKAQSEGEEYNEEHEYEYVEAHLFVCGSDWIQDTKDSSGKVINREEQGIVLFAKLEKNIDKYQARSTTAGRALGEGITEDLFEHQKWHNHSKTEDARMNAIAGKKLYWSDDPDVLANIFDEGIDHGTVLRVGQGKILSELNQIPTGVPVNQASRQEWDVSADRVTSSFNSKIGEESKSGTPFRAQYLQNIEASSQFEQYREDIGFLVQSIVEDWNLPAALKDISSEEAIFETFSEKELLLIDEVIITESVNKEFYDRTMAGQVLTPEGLIEIEQKASQELRKGGKRRQIKEIQKFIKNVKGKIRIHTTDEARNKAVYFESLGNALAMLAPEDPRRNAIVDRIMDAIGISKEETELYATGEIAGAPNPQLETEQLQQESQSTPALQLTA
jgi:hypothetical protein